MIGQDLSFIGLILLVVVSTWVLFYHRRRSDQAVLVAMQEQISALVAAHGLPINLAYKEMLARELTHAHTPELDALLARAGPPSDLSAEEFERMSVMLVERYESIDDDQISPKEKKAALIYPIVLQRANEEYEAAQQLRAKIGGDGG